MDSLSQRISLPFTTIEVETLAAQRGLELAMETSFERFILEGDSQIIITALKEDSHSLSNFCLIAKDIQYLPLIFQC